MATLVPAFEYGDLQGDQIRVINIESGGWDEIACKLRHIDLPANQPPPLFVALSYVWGVERDDQPVIRLNGKPFSVTSNLHAALRWFRELDCDWPFWIDAICINQRNKAEKEVQILRMGLIYSSAKVLAYLGETTPEDDTAIQTVFEKATEMHKTLANEAEVVNFFEDCDRNPWIENYLWEDDRPKFLDAVRTFMLHFFRKPWWRRVWTFQEICLTGKDKYKMPELMCGPYAVSFEALLVFWRALRSSVRAPEDSILYARTMQIDLIHLARQARANRSLPRDSAEFAHQLVETLQQVVDRQAKVPNDIIYGVLGMVDDRWLPVELKPDYDRTPEEVFFECSKFLFKETGCLSLMITTKNELQGLPSWVPDLRFLAPQKNSSARSRIEVNSRKMRVQGAKIDEVELFVPRKTIPIDAAAIGQALVAFENIFLRKAAQIRGETLTTTIDAWLRPILEVPHILQNSPLATMSEFAGPLKSLRVRVLRSAISPDFDVVYSKYRDCYNRLISGDPVAVASTSTMDGQLHYLHAQLVQARFLTTSGKLGSLHRADTTLEARDVLCMLKGMACEVVLRPVEGGFFQVLGTCQMSDADPLEVYDEEYFSSLDIEDWWLV